MTEVGMYYQQKDYKGTSHPLFIEYFLSRNIIKSVIINIIRLNTIIVPLS